MVIVSSQKKRRLDPLLSSSSEIPLPSIEIPDTTQYSAAAATDLQASASDLSISEHLALPPHISSRLHQEAPSVASSPSAAYAGLTISDTDVDGGIDSQNKRSQSPKVSFPVHRAIMGGATDNTQRSSSPMKRRASDFEEDVTQAPEITGTLDVEMAPAEEAASHPPIDEQIQTVTQMLADHQLKPLSAGDRTYLVSNAWLARVQARGSSAKARPEDVEGKIGPIDNSDIVLDVVIDANNTSFAKLRPEVSQDSYSCLSTEAWQYVLKIYGLKEGQIPVMRVAVNTNTVVSGVPNIQYELNPPIITVHRLWQSDSPFPLPATMKAKDPEAPIFVVSRPSLFVDLMKNMKEATEIQPYQSVRVWKAVRPLPAGPQMSNSSSQLSPPPSRPSSPAAGSQHSWPKLLVLVNDFLKLEQGVNRELIDHKDNSTNKNYNGKSITIDLVGLGAEEELFLDETIEKDIFVTTYSAATASSLTIDTVRSAQNKAQNYSGRSSPAPSGPMTRGRTGKSSGRTLGAVGLSNLGNTCYMNSALQCVRNVEELTKYFLTEKSLDEINYENPLGNNGEVALRYGNLLKEMYSDSVPSSVTPRSFKQTIGKYAPSFSGYGQQDSQEFLGFLLDGLQEDLSRVKKKPYIEKPDSTDEMVGNDELIREMAEKVWDITKKRDDSVIADLFTGMYKSTLVCPVCDKVSITFDPFNNLTLQLPIESIWKHEIFYFPLNSPPIRICVELDKQASLKGVKQFISKRVDVPFEKLFISETWKHKFYKHHHEDFKAASEEIMPNDEILVFELEAVPTNTVPAKLKSKARSSTLDMGEGDTIPSWDDPMSERLLVPVMHRRPNTGQNRWKKWEMAPMPHFIVVTTEEAQSEDSIRRKVLEKVASFTTYPACHGDNGVEDFVDSIDPDIVVTNASDADSSNDGKVIATSVDGEEDVVDVTMGDSSSGPSVSTAPSLTSHESTNRHKIKASKRPRWMNPREQIPPELQQMFDIKYYTNPRELVPVGWQTVDEDKEFPLLSSRGPQEQQAEEILEESGANGVDNGSESEVSDEDDDLDLGTNTRMNDESSEDELALPRPLPIRPAARARVRNHNPRRWKTYSKKKLQPAAYNRLPIDDGSEEADALDDGPLIRLGEGLIIDWSADAFEVLFGNDNDPEDPLRGVPTYKDIDLLDDAELNAKRATRERRKKRGITLDECLDEFGKEEILSEQDTWYCPRCKEHRRASKKFELWKTPDILVIHLKRFSSSGLRRDKLDVEVDFPLEGLDLTSRVIDKQSGKVEIYDLFAVDDHWGGLGGGHYTAFAKSFIDGLWYEYNDSSVSKANTTNIVSKGAYLLFYRRRSDEPLGGPRLKEIVDAYNKPTQENEDDESGEGQRLDGVSSQHGSSSALIGAGAIHQADGLAGGEKNRSLLSQNLAAEGTIDPSSISHLPAYSQHLDDEHGAPILVLEAMMNDGLEMEDEGVDLGSGHSGGFTSINQATWDWSNINQANTGSAIDDFQSDRSDAAAHQSTASTESLRGRLEDFDSAPVHYGGIDDDDYKPDEVEIPDMDDDTQAGMIGLHEDLREQATMGLQYNATMVHNNDDNDDEPAAEIHVEENEGLNIK